MSDIYQESMNEGKRDVGLYIEKNLKEQKTFGYVKPYIPVIEPPVVRKVWVPDHKLEDDPTALVAGHWVYLMVKGPKWFIDEEVRSSIVPVIIPVKKNQEGLNEKK